MQNQRKYGQQMQQQMRPYKLCRVLVLYYLATNKQEVRLILHTVWLLIQALKVLGQLSLLTEL